MATPLCSCSCTAALHELGKLTLPKPVTSWACTVPATKARETSEPASARAMDIPPLLGGPAYASRPAWSIRFSGRPACDAFTYPTTLRGRQLSKVLPVTRGGNRSARPAGGFPPRAARSAAPGPRRLDRTLRSALIDQLSHAHACRNHRLRKGLADRIVAALAVRAAQEDEVCREVRVRHLAVGVGEEAGH